MDKTLLITRIIRPVVKALVWMGCDFNTVKTIIQTEFVNEAKSLLNNNAARIYAKTGIDRRIVAKILADKPLWLPTNGVDLVARELSEIDEDQVVLISDLKKIIKNKAHGRYTDDAVIDELVATKRMTINDGIVKFLSKSLRGNFSVSKYSQLLGDSIDISSQSFWHLQNNNNDLYYRWDFSQQIHPSDRHTVNAKLFKLAKKHKNENLECIARFESTEERIYPKIGMLQVQFDFNNYYQN